MVQDSPAGPPISHYWPLLLVLWLAEVTGAFGAAMILAILKYLIADYGSPALVGWTVTISILVGAASAAVFGRLGDLYGRRRVMILVLLIGLAGSLICAVATNFALLLTGRALQGAIGAVLPLGIGMVRERLPQHHVAAGIGWILSGAAVGTAAGLLLGGYLADSFGWHMVFAACAVLCVLTIAGTIWRIAADNVTTTPDRLDWLSALLFVPGIALVLLGISTSAKAGWSTNMGLAMMAGSVFLALWVRRSLSIPQSLLDLRQFRDRPVLVTNILSALLAMGAFQASLLFSLLLQTPAWTGTGLGLTALQAGVAAVPATGVGVIGGPLAGQMISRFGGRFTILAAGLVIIAGWIAAALLHDSVAAIVAVWCTINLGTAAMLSAGSIVLAQHVSPERTSEASGMLVVVRGIAQSVGAMLVTTLLATDSVREAGGTAHYPTEAALFLTVTTMTAIGVACLASTLWLPRNSSVRTVS